jgi:hypothetical protein
MGDQGLLRGLVADLLDRAGQLADPAFKCRLMRGQRGRQTLGIISEYPRDLGQAQAKRAQGVTISAVRVISSGRRRAIRPRCDQGLSGRVAHRAANAFAETPSLGAAAERVRNLAEELTNHLWFADRCPYRGGPGGRVKRAFERVARRQIRVQNRGLMH